MSTVVPWLDETHTTHIKYLRATSADEQRVGIPRYIVDHELLRVSMIIDMLMSGLNILTSLSMLSVYQHILMPVSSVFCMTIRGGMKELTRLSVNPISANSGKAVPITRFMSSRQYKGTVLMSSELYFVRGVEMRLKI